MKDDHVHPVTTAIRELLRARGAVWQEMQHAPAVTSEAAAAARSMNVALGCKSIVTLTGGTEGELHVFVVPGFATIDWARARIAADRRRLRLAPPETMVDLLALRPGTIPPFGRPILNATLIADVSLSQPRMNAPDIVAFAAGSAELSFVMERNAWMQAAAPKFASLVREPE